MIRTFTSYSLSAFFLSFLSRESDGKTCQDSGLSHQGTVELCAPGAGLRGNQPKRTALAERASRACQQCLDVCLLRLELWLSWPILSWAQSFAMTTSPGDVIYPPAHTAPVCTRPRVNTIVMADRTGDLSLCCWSQLGPFFREVNFPIIHFEGSPCWVFLVPPVEIKMTRESHRGHCQAISATLIKILFKSHEKQTNLIIFQIVSVWEHIYAF